MTRKTNLLVLLGAAAVTVLAIAGFSNAASTAAPVNTAEPKITGTAQDGQTLTASSGTWTSTSTITYKYQWRRCNTQGNGCSNISGADSSDYQLRTADVAHTVRVRVTARNTDGSATSDSNQTAVVATKTAPPPTTVNGCPTSGSGTLDVSAIAPPARLVRPHHPVPRLGVQRPLDLERARLRDGRPVPAVLDPRGDADRFRRLGHDDDAPGGLIPGLVAAAAARRVRAGPEVGRALARRRFHPPAGLVPGSPLAAG